MASVDDLWLVDLDEPHPGEPAAHRAALVIGPPDTFGPGFPFVIVAASTTTRRGLSLQIEVVPSPQSGLDDVSYIQRDLIRCISRIRLVRRLGTVDAQTSHRAADVVKTLLNY